MEGDRAGSNEIEDPCEASLPLFRHLEDTPRGPVDRNECTDQRDEKRLVGFIEREIEEYTTTSEPLPLLQCRAVLRVQSSAGTGTAFVALRWRDRAGRRSKRTGRGWWTALAPVLGGAVGGGNLHGGFRRAYRVEG
jgi:hypothetical protein